MPNDPLPEDFFDLGRARSVRGRGLRLGLPLAERLRVARGLPQAIVKVTGFASGKAQLLRHLRYISRDGKLTLETDQGLELADVEDQKAFAENWAVQFDDRKRSRDTANIVFSMPPGSSVQALRQAVRKTARNFFPDHEWLFAIHEDRNHPHAHLVVQMRGREMGKKLRLRKAELYQLRESFAEAAREQGVPLAASPRSARGVGRRGVTRAVYQMRQRGVTPNVDRNAVEEMSSDAANSSDSGKPWEAAIQQRYRKERDAYRTEAAALRQAAAEYQGEEREKLTRAATDLEKFSETMPQPMTRRQLWRQRLMTLRRSRSSEVEKDPRRDRDIGKEM